jgi:uncharacterized repeat protein (TIGR01451 family)
MWSLQVKDEAALTQVSEGFENNIISPNAIDTAMIAFEFQNQSVSSEVQDIVARNDSAEIIELSANDINNDLLSYDIISLPLHGNISGTAPNIVYRPDAGYTGKDSFAVSASSVSGTEKNITISIDVVSLPHPASVIIRSPSNGEVYAALPGQQSVTIPVRATSTGDVQSINFYDYASLIGSGNCEDASGRCPVTIFHDFFVGTHVLTAKAVSAKDGNSCPSIPVVITVNPSQPIVRITSPLPGQIFTSPEDITITAEVTDSNPVSSVEFYANSQKIWSTTEGGPTHTYVWKGATPGVYNIVVKAIENPSTVSVSKAVLIIVVPEKPLSKSDLALTMSSTSNPAPLGGFFNYILTVTNRGPDSATDVTVQDYLPPELKYISSKPSQGDYNPDSEIWKLGGLIKYRSARLVLNVQVLPTAHLGQVANTGYVYGAERDPDNSNNHAIVNTRIEESWATASDANSTEFAAPDANATEVASSDVSSSEAVVPDENSTEVAIPDVSFAEEAVPDANATEVASSDVSSLEAAVPDENSTEVAIPDVSFTEAAVPDENSTEVAIPDVSSAESAVPDENSTEVAIPDVSSLEAAVPDANATEVFVPDVSSTESAVPDANSTEVASSEVSSAEAAIPDANATEVFVPDVSSIESAVPDANSTEVASSEVSSAEAAIPDANATVIAPSDANATVIVPLDSNATEVASIQT